MKVLFWSRTKQKPRRSEAVTQGQKESLVRVCYLAS